MRMMKNELKNEEDKVEIMNKVMRIVEKWDNE